MRVYTLINLSKNRFFGLSRGQNMGKSSSLNPLTISHLCLPPHSKNPPMEPLNVYQALNKTVARNLLSGHLIAIRYNTYIKIQEVDGHVDFAARWYREFKLFLG
jgi:hypothetical protein